MNLTSDPIAKYQILIEINDNCIEINLDDNKMISNLLFPVLAIIRKTFNNYTLINNNNEKKATIATKTFTIKNLIAEYKNYSNYKDFYYKNASTLIDMLTALNLDLNETRISGSKSKITNSWNQIAEIKISLFGLKDSHKFHLTGIIYKSERTFDLIRTMGVLAHPILLSAEKSQSYNNSGIESFVCKKKYPKKVVHSRLRTAAKNVSVLGNNDEPKVKNVSKLVSAKLLEPTTTMQPMIINYCVFAGFRKRHYSDAFFQYMDPINWKNKIKKDEQDNV